MKRTFLAGLGMIPGVALAQTQSWDWPGPWHMWAGGWWIFPLLMMVLMVVCCVLMMNAMGFGRSRRDAGAAALRLLGERFAKGEITKEEFEEKRSTLERRA